MALGDGIRRNIAHVEPSERALLRDAFKQLNQRYFPGTRTDSPAAGGVSWWFKQDEIHQATHVHGGPGFIPWHREIVNRLEQMLRQINPQLSLHYWDWTQDPRNIPNANLGGGATGNLNLFTADFMGYGGAASASIGEPWLSAGYYVPGTANDRDATDHGYGAYAEYVVAKETETALKPKSIDHVHASTIPVGAVTAWRALFDTAGLKEGQKVLIHGAAGGVGTFAVQLAKWKGAHVIGTASTRNQAFLRDLGVDEPIDYEKTRFEDAVDDVDVVFDPIGGETQKRSWRTLKKGGILVSIVGPPSVEEAKKHDVRSAYLSAQGGSSLLAELATLVDSGKLKPMVEKVLPLSEARQAHELNETGHARGKIVLKVA